MISAFVVNELNSAQDALYKWQKGSLSQNGPQPWSSVPRALGTSFLDQGIEVIRPLALVIESVAFAILSLITVPYYLIADRSKMAEGMRMTLTNTKAAIRNAALFPLKVVLAPFTWIAQTWLIMNEGKNATPSKKNFNLQKLTENREGPLFTKAKMDRFEDRLYRGQNHFADTYPRARFAAALPLAPILALIDVVSEVIKPIFTAIEASIKMVLGRYQRAGAASVLDAPSNSNQIIPLGAQQPHQKLHESPLSDSSHQADTNSIEAAQLRAQEAFHKLDAIAEKMEQQIQSGTFAAQGVQLQLQDPKQMFQVIDKQIQEQQVQQAQVSPLLRRTFAYANAAAEGIAEMIANVAMSPITLLAQTFAIFWDMKKVSASRIGLYMEPKMTLEHQEVISANIPPPSLALKEETSIDL